MEMAYGNTARQTPCGAFAICCPCQRSSYAAVAIAVYYTEVREKDRIYYEFYTLPRTEEAPDGYKEISFVWLRSDGR